MKGRGTIMEIRDQSMVIMTSDCGFEEIKKRSNVIEGMEIEFTQQDIIRQKKSYFKPLISMAAAIILMIISSLFVIPNFTAEATTVAMVTIDINPSIALELNHKQEVVKIIPLNEDAERLPIKSLKGKNVRDAVEEIMTAVEGEGYLEEEDNYVLITTVAFEEEAEKEAELTTLAEELKTSIEKTAVEKEGKNVVVLTLDSSYETLVKAQEEKTSVGKMEFYQRLETNEDEEDLKLEDIKTKKVKELVEVSEKKAHPVFKEHPGKGKEKSESNKNPKDGKAVDSSEGESSEEDSSKEEVKGNSNKTQKTHPVFQQHPGKKDGQENPASKKEEKESKVDEKKAKKDEKKSQNEKKQSEEDEKDPKKSDQEQSGKDGEKESGDNTQKNNN